MEEDEEEGAAMAASANDGHSFSGEEDGAGRKRAPKAHECRRLVKTVRWDDRVQ